jgi:hypothetical protein
MGAIASHFPSWCPFTISIGFFTLLRWGCYFQAAANATVRAKGFDTIHHNSSDWSSLMS